MGGNVTQTFLDLLTRLAALASSSSSSLLFTLAASPPQAYIVSSSQPARSNRTAAATSLQHDYSACCTSPLCASPPSPKHTHTHAAPFAALKHRQLAQSSTHCPLLLPAPPLLLLLRRRRLLPLPLPLLVHQPCIPHSTPLLPDQRQWSTAPPPRLALQHSNGG